MLLVLWRRWGKVWGSAPGVGLQDPQSHLGAHPVLPRSGTDPLISLPSPAQPAQPSSEDPQFPPYFYQVAYSAPHHLPWPSPALSHLPGVSHHDPQHPPRSPASPAHPRHQQVTEPQCFGLGIPRTLQKPPRRSDPGATTCLQMCHEFPKLSWGLILHPWRGKRRDKLFEPSRKWGSKHRGAKPRCIQVGNQP